MSPEDVEATPDTAQEVVPEKTTAKKSRTAKEDDKPEPVAEAKGKKKSSTIDDVMATIKNMSVLELSQLVKAL